jgi:hypothetical protein
LGELCVRKDNSSLDMTAKEAALQTAIAALSNSAADTTPPKRTRSNSRIMYIEHKGGELIGPARIGRVTFSRTGCTLYYGDLVFQSLKGQGFKANYFEITSGDTYWISGPKRDGSDRLYGERIAIEIDDDVREEYWTEVRGHPDLMTRSTV